MTPSDLSIPCPTCGTKTVVLVSRLQVDSVFHCSFCGRPVQVEVDQIADTVRLQSHAPPSHEWASVR